MQIFPQDWIERIYAGWLAKLIGVRLGAPVEGWEHERVMETHRDTAGFIDRYDVFGADDDINGPLFFMRALHDLIAAGGRAEELTDQDVAHALLNYAPYEHGFFWWGGYGISTEHTAYLNLRSGIPAPRSGSIEQNGPTVAEQIGGQIFIDGWGLVAPGNPELAARLARAAASVTHGGDGVHGGIFIASLISLAFIESDIERLLDRALEQIPDGSGYARLVGAVRSYHRELPGDWQAAFRRLREEHGYDRHGGGCHILPNSGIIVLALLYGEGDFDRTIRIANLCGWDTDCNVGNVACIMGVLGGLGAIDQERWITPVHDQTIASSVLGSRNVQDATAFAAYLVRMAALLGDYSLPSPWDRLLLSTEGEESVAEAGLYHFEFPSSTQGFELERPDAPMIVDDGSQRNYLRVAGAELDNSRERAHTGERSLGLRVSGAVTGERLRIARRSFYGLEDFEGRGYRPEISPQLYPGQEVRAFVCTTAGARVSARMTIRLRSSTRPDGRGAAARVQYEWLTGPERTLTADWSEVSWTLPDGAGRIIDSFGLLLTPLADQDELTVWIDDIAVDGTASADLMFAQEANDYRGVNGWSRFRGLLRQETDGLHLSGAGRAEAYCGDHRWAGGILDVVFIPQLPGVYRLLAAVQGAERCLALSLHPGELRIEHKMGDYETLDSTTFDWSAGERLTLEFRVSEAGLSAAVTNAAGERRSLGCRVEKAWLGGCVGLGTDDNGHLLCERFMIREALVPSVRL